MEDTLEICLDAKLYRLRIAQMYLSCLKFLSIGILHEHNDNRSYAKINLKRFSKIVNTYTIYRKGVLYM